MIEHLCYCPVLTLQGGQRRSRSRSRPSPGPGENSFSIDNQENNSGRGKGSNELFFDSWGIRHPSVQVRPKHPDRMQTFLLVHMTVVMTMTQLSSVSRSASRINFRPPTHCRKSGKDRIGTPPRYSSSSSRKDGPGPE